MGEERERWSGGESYSRTGAGLAPGRCKPSDGPAVAITDFLICLFSNEGTTPSAGTDRITELPRLFGSIGATHPDAGTVRAWRAGCPRSGASRRDTGITCRSRTSIGGCPRSPSRLFAPAVRRARTLARRERGARLFDPLPLIQVGTEVRVEQQGAYWKIENGEQ